MDTKLLHSYISRKPRVSTQAPKAILHNCVPNTYPCGYWKQKDRQKSHYYLKWKHVIFPKERGIDH